MLSDLDSPWVMGTAMIIGSPCVQPISGIRLNRKLLPIAGDINLGEAGSYPDVATS
jgi:hypothetical protein